MRPRFFPLCALALLPCLLAACSASQQYYRLNADGPAPLTNAGISLGVGPVSVPGYLDRAELVFQSSDNQFQVPAKVFWAGTLQENITRALATDLARRLGSGNVLPYPWPPGSRLRYQMALEVRQFQAVSGSGAILEVTWRIEDPTSRRTLRRGSGSYREPIVGDGYGAVAAAESRLIAQLADAIARSLRF